MALCFGNLSIGILARLPEFLFTVTSRKVEGALGKHYDQLLVYKNERNCKFVPIKYVWEGQVVGDDDEINKTLNFMFKHGQMDVYSDSRELSNIIDFVDDSDSRFVESFLEKSKIVGVEDYNVGQILDKPTTQANDFFFFLFQNVSIFSVTLIGHLLLILIGFIILRKRIVYLFKLLNLTYKKLMILSTKIATVFLFFNLFMLVNVTLLVNNMNTEKMIINTDSFIDSVEKLEKSPFILAYFREEIQLFSKAPKQNFLYRLYEKKIKQENNFLELRGFSKDASINEVENKFLERGKLNSYFLFMRKFVITCVFASISQYTNNQLAFIKPTSYYEALKVIHLRKNLDHSKKERIHNRINRFFESGIYGNFYVRSNDAVKKFIKPDLIIYENLKDFLTDYTSSYLISGVVEFDNFKRTFFYYFLSNLLILHVFIASRLLECLIRSYRLLKYKYIFRY